MNVRAIQLSLAVFLFAAGTASAQRLNGGFFIDGDEETIDNSAGLVIDGTEFFIEGEAGGLGTDGDIVEIRYFTEAPTNVNADDEQARVRQSRFSTLEFSIASDVPERDLDLTINPDKCSIDGKINDPKSKGSVTVVCSGDNIFALISASQEASIQAAFQSTKNVKFKVTSDGSKGTLRITLKGPAGTPA